jgi:hypothetical protein
MEPSQVSTALLDDAADYGSLQDLHICLSAVKA